MNLKGSRYDPCVAELAAVVFDFDGIVLDSETPEFESHRRIYERYGVALTVDEWCDQIGVWTEEHDERWATQLRARSRSAPDCTGYHAERRRIHLMLGNPAVADRAKGANVRATLHEDDSSDRILRLNRRPQDFWPAWTVCSQILLGSNKHIEILRRSNGFESPI
jgi:hypothetical protein